jgi:hypothetical protein
MKIKITLDKGEAINAALARTNGKATAHTFTHSSSVSAAARIAEADLDDLGIPKGQRAGATARARSGGKLPNAYGNHTRVVTHITITRGSSAWFLTDIKAVETWDKSAGGTYVTVTPEQDAIAIAKFRASYSVAKVVAEVAS